MSFLGIADIIGTAMTNNENHNQAIYNRKFQKEENEKVRAHNLELAKMQNSWNIQQWNRENAYNHPSAQKARLEAAGLNADMMYGGSGVMNTSASSPQMTAGAPASYQDWSGFYAPYQAPSFSNILDNQMKQAQIDNINADTEKKGHEASILASDASFRDAWNQGQLDTTYSNIRLQGKQGELTDQQIKESQSRIMKIDSEMSQIDAQIKQIYNAIRNDNVRLELDKALSEVNIKKLAASANLDYASAKSISDQLEHIINNLKADNDLKLQQRINIGHEGEILLNQSEEAQFNATIRTFEGWDSDMTFYQNASKFVLQLLHGVSSFIPGAKGIVR